MQVVLCQMEVALLIPGLECNFLVSSGFYAVFWNQIYARVEIMLACALKGCFFVTALYEEHTHLCQIQINKYIIRLTARIQRKLCSVSVAWRKKKILWSAEELQ